MRLGVNVILERQVMDTMFLGFFISDRQYFRFNEIANLSNVKKPSLQRILPRLVKRGWIEKTTKPSYSGLKPEGRVFHLLSYDEAKKQTYRELKMKVLFPSDLAEEFKTELKKLEKKRNIKIPYQEREKILRRGRIKGRTELWKKIAAKKAKKFSFYRIKEYPYLDRILGGRLKSKEKIKIPKWNVPEGTKRFWKDSAKEFRKLRDEFFDTEVKRIDLANRALARVYPRKYKFR